MADPRGVYHKYDVRRTDGKPMIGGCFVLQVSDPNAWPALLLWADTVQAAGHPRLAIDIRAIVLAAQQGLSPIVADDA